MKNQGYLCRLPFRVWVEAVYGVGAGVGADAVCERWNALSIKFSQ